MIPAIVAYVIIGIAASGVSTLAFDDIDTPPGSQPALVFIVGLFWPVVLVAAAATALCYAALDVGRGFAVLWGHARARVEAREHPPDKRSDRRSDRQEGN